MGRGKDTQVKQAANADRGMSKHWGAGQKHSLRNGGMQKWWIHSGGGSFVEGIIQVIFVEGIIQVISYLITRRIGFLGDWILFPLEGFSYVFQWVPKIMEDRKALGWGLGERREICRQKDDRSYAWMHQNINYLIYSRILNECFYKRMICIFNSSVIKTIVENMH